MMSKEIWKPIKGYEGYYSVSNLGNVRTDRKMRTLKPKIDKDGYFEYCFCTNNKRKYFRGHRLVAEAFIPNPDNLPIINHKDGDKQNNIPNNLEWCSSFYNTIHGYTQNLKHKVLSNLTQEDFKELLHLYTNCDYRYNDIIEHFNLDCCNDEIADVLKGRRFTNYTGLTYDIRRPKKYNYKHPDSLILNILSDYYIHHQDFSVISKKLNINYNYVYKVVHGLIRKKEYETFKENHAKKEK